MKRWPVALAGAGLCAALVASALDPPTSPASTTPVSLPTYTPAAAAKVVAQVAPRDAREVAMRRALVAKPDRVDLAVQLARADIQKSRSRSDPRYLGRAQAELARWYDLPEPPVDVLFLRATIRQSLHDFVGARADLDRLLERRPDDAEGYLTRAVVATIMSDFGVARDSCAAVGQLADPLIAMTCLAPIDGLQGHAPEAYQRLTSAVESSPRADVSIRAWSITAVGELAVMQGDDAAGRAAFEQVLALDPDDAYSRAALADVMLLHGQAAEASKLLAGREAIDNLLVRRAIAEHVAKGPEEQKLVKAMRDRIAAAAERGDRIHMREEAMFVLRVEEDPARAVAIARDDFAVQRELADARLLAASAKAAHDPLGLDTITAWRKAAGVHDAQLDALLGAP